MDCLGWSPISEVIGLRAGSASCPGLQVADLAAGQPERLAELLLRHRSVANGGDRSSGASRRLPPAPPAAPGFQCSHASCEGGDIDVDFHSFEPARPARAGERGRVRESVWPWRRGWVLPGRRSCSTGATGRSSTMPRRVCGRRGSRWLWRRSMSPTTTLSWRVSGDRAGCRADRHPGQQCRHPAPGAVGGLQGGDMA